MAFGAAEPDNGPDEGSDDLHLGHPPTTSASTPPAPHTRPVTCVLHVAQVSLGVLLPQEPPLPAQTPYQAHHSRAEGPEGQPSAPWQRKRTPRRLRQRAVQAPQRSRADDQPPEEPSRRRDPLRQAGLRLPRHRRPSRNPTLAPTMICRETPQSMQGSSTVGIHGDNSASVCCVTTPRTGLSTRTSFSWSGSSSSRMWRSP